MCKPPTDNRYVLHWLLRFGQTLYLHMRMYAMIFVRKTQSAEAREELQDPSDEVRTPFNKEIKDRISEQHKPFPSGYATPKFLDA